MIFRYLILFLSMSIITGCGTSKKAIELAKPLPKTVNILKKTLLFNGSGILTASKFGFTAKIYRAGLYLEEKSQDGSAILKSDLPKFLFMRFVFSAPRGEMQSGWTKSYNFSCYLDCKETRKNLREFIKLMPNLKVGQIMTIAFLPDSVELKLDDKILGTIKSRSFSKNLLAVYIGEKVLDKKFKNQLLGINL